jgi:hypothetical protein
MDSNGQAVAAAGAIGGVLLIVYLALLVLMLAAVWRVFTKAGQPGWAVLIPFYNLYVLLQVAGKPGWWLLLLLIPVVNLFVGIITLAALAAKFGKGIGFTIGLILLPIVFYPVLGFGGAQYQGASTRSA